MLGWHRENAHAHSTLEAKRGAQTGRVYQGRTLGTEVRRAQPALLSFPEGPGALPDARTRLDRYRMSGTIIQQLLDSLYGSMVAYSQATIRHPLEDAVWAYNEVMGIDGLVRAVAERYGFLLAPDEDADLGFINAITTAGQQQ